MTHRLRQPLLTALACAVFLALGTASGVAAVAPTKITISYSSNIADFLAILTARDAGYYKKHGLDVTVRHMPAREGIPALINHQVQVAGIGGSNAVAAEAQGVKLKLVMTLYPYYPFTLMAQPKYASAKALKGRRIGFTSRTGSLYAGTLLALKDLGLKPSDVELTPLGRITNVNAALLAGSIAAAVSGPPGPYKFKKAGLTELVDLPKDKIPLIDGGLCVSQSFAQSHREVVQKVVDAVLEAIKREQSDRAYSEKEMTKYFRIKDKGELDAAYNFYIKDLSAQGLMPEIKQIKSTIKTLSIGNPKVKTVDAASMIDQTFVKNAEK